MRVVEELVHRETLALRRHPGDVRVRRAGALEEAGRNGANLESTAMIDKFYAEVQAMGGHRWDTSSLVARLET